MITKDPSRMPDPYWKCAGFKTSICTVFIGVVIFWFMFFSDLFFISFIFFFGILLKNYQELV